MYKRKGSHMGMEMYHSMLLAEVVGKIPARAYRLANLGALAQELSSEHTWQCGGVPGLGTEFPVLAMRLLQKKNIWKAPSSHEFSWTQGDFCYATITKLIRSVVETDQAIINMCDHFKNPPAAMKELKTILGKSPAMAGSNLSNQIVRDIASTFTASHFDERGSSKFGAAHKDIRPGHSYADVVFSFAFHQVIKVLAFHFDSNDFMPGAPAAFSRKDICKQEKKRGCRFPF